MTVAKPRPLLAPGETRTYPVLPLRDVVVFPHMIASLFVGRKKSILALERRNHHRRAPIQPALARPQYSIVIEIRLFS